MVPWLGTTWLIFTVLGTVHKFRERIWALYERHGGNFKTYLLVGMVSAYLVEVLAVIDNLTLPPEERILLNPDPLADLYLAFAYYLPFVLYWGLAVREYDYSWKDVFWIGGATRILMEQTGAVFLSFNPVAWLYVLLVYGSYKAIPVLAAGDCLRKRRRKQIGTGKKLALGALIEALAFVSAGGLLWIFRRIGGLG
ncbi:hypothetical protein [Thermococcus profundus]|nr:hypothetical protein [Thermococcus profundus]